MFFPIPCLPGTMERNEYIEDLLHLERVALYDGLGQVLLCRPFLC